MNRNFKKEYTMSKVLIYVCLLSCCYSLPIFLPPPWSYQYMNQYHSQPVAIEHRNDFAPNDMPQYFPAPAAPILNDQRFSVGEFIMGISWLPIEINVPDTISWIGNGISSAYSSLSQRFPWNSRPKIHFPEFNRPFGPLFPNPWLASKGMIPQDIQMHGESPMPDLNTVLRTVILVPVEVFRIPMNDKSNDPLEEAEDYGLVKAV